MELLGLINASAVLILLGNTVILVAMLSQNTHDDRTQEQRGPRSRLISTAALVILHTVFNPISIAPPKASTALCLSVYRPHAFKNTLFKRLSSHDGSSKSVNEMRAVFAGGRRRKKQVQNRESRNAEANRRSSLITSCCFI